MKREKLVKEIRKLSIEERNDLLDDLLDDFIDVDRFQHGGWKYQRGDPLKKTPKRPAKTILEIEGHLIKESQKRGFKKGVRFKPMERIKGVNIVDMSFTPFTYEYDAEADELSIFGIPIYRQNKWAEIIEEEKIKVGMNEYTENELKDIIKVYESLDHPFQDIMRVYCNLS
jgi:hypothetical protein